MKKIVRQQNYLRELIEEQANRPITRQILKSSLRAVLEPLLDKPETGVVLYRIINKTGLAGILKRLEYSPVEALDFSDDSENIKEKVWADTEFLCVLTHRFVSIFVWDNKTENKNYVRYYSIWNSRLQTEALDIVARNSTIDIKSYQEKFKPDRRDNLLLNSSVRRLVENMDEAAKDAVLGYAEFQTEPVKEYSSDVREIAHEIKNQLSICDLYSDIIRKYCEKNLIQDETILTAAESISRAVKISANIILSLKTTQKKELKQCDLKNIISSVEDLTKVYFECKNIEYTVESKGNLRIEADEDGLISVIINLVKNAVEAFECENQEKECNKEIENGKYIKIKTEKRGDFAVIRVINNAGKITKPEKIFEQGYTTKKSGQGLGLCICKKNIEEQSGQLKLEHTGDNYTEFSIKFALAK